MGVPAGPRSARPDPTPASAWHRPVAPRARAARWVSGRVPDPDPAGRALGAVQRPAQPAAFTQSGRVVVGVLRTGLRDARLGAAGPGGAARRAARARHSEPRAETRCTGVALPAGSVPTHGVVPVADRA